jgi:molybdate transport system ATP-binding protein
VTVWDVALRKLLRHGASGFALDVQFRSEARRVVLHGPSGAGKTQTLRMIAGISAPDDGHVAIAGRVVFDRARGVSLSPQQRRLAYVFQDYALFPHLTVRQNIAFALASGWRNPRRSVRDARADRWIERFRLQSVAGRYPHQLSVGQRQRTALARALVSEPSALLLDEPFAALDTALRSRLRDSLVALQERLGLQMLMITHDPADVEALGQQVLEIRDGRIHGDARSG